MEVAKESVAKSYCGGDVDQVAVLRKIVMAINYGLYSFTTIVTPLKNSP